MPCDTSTITPTSAPASSPRPLGALDEIEAARLACSFLVEGCEHALFRLLRSLGEARAASDVRSGLRAADRVREVLAGWRDTLTAVEAQAGERPQHLPALNRH